MNIELRCPDCDRLMGVDVIGNLIVDYSSNLMSELNQGLDLPPSILEIRCKYCKCWASIYNERSVNLWLNESSQLNSRNGA